MFYIFFYEIIFKGQQILKEFFSIFLLHKNVLFQILLLIAKILFLIMTYESNLIKIILFIIYYIVIIQVYQSSAITILLKEKQKHTYVCEQKNTYFYLSKEYISAVVTIKIQLFTKHILYDFFHNIFFIYSIF